MQEEIFADAIGEINVTSNVVRIDFVSLSPTQRDANNNPKTVFRQRVVMPVSAFGNAAELIRRVMEDLVKTGAIRHETPTAPPDSPTEAWHKRTLDTTTATAGSKKRPPQKFQSRRIFLWHENCL